MVIVGYGIAPHGVLVLPDTKNKSNKKNLVLNEAMNRLANEILSLDPDIIFISTPHGVALENDFGIYLNEVGKGTAEWSGEFTEYSLEIKLDYFHSKSLVTFLKNSNHNIQGITAFISSLPVELRWGEVIPLYFIKSLPVKIIIMSQPTRRYSEAKSMIDELELLGASISKYLLQIKEKVFVLISGDLAHTFNENGPYGFSEDAEPFDEAIASWITKLDKSYLYHTASSLLDNAKSCGFTGFVMLQGMFNSLNLKSNLYAIEHPSYYGMAVASFQEEK